MKVEVSYSFLSQKLKIFEVIASLEKQLHAYTNLLIAYYYSHDYCQGIINSFFLNIRDIICQRIILSKYGHSINGKQILYQRHLELLYEMRIIQAVKFGLNIIFKMKDFLFSIKESKLQWLNVYIFTLTIILNNYFSYLQLSATLSLSYILFLYSAT